MDRKPAGLAERRSQLVAQVAAQRASLAHELKPWRAHPALADHGIAAFRYVRSRPALILAPARLFAVLRPRHVSIWLRRGWLAWQVGGWLRGF